jgi:alkanesulfonate monooxygenase
MNSQLSIERAQAPQAAVSLEIFSTCPQSSQVSKEAYFQNVVDVARWSEEFGYRGILVYTDNSIADPWLVSQVIIENTETLCPLVAIQPIYMHPYTAAKMAATYGYLFNRRIYLNMLAGGFKNDLVALNDNTPHDRRYDRTVEYTRIIKLLLSNTTGVSFDGEFYTIDKLRMTPTLPPELFPGILISGSSEAGLAAAKAIGATAVKYPKPPGEYENDPPDENINSGVRLGIITREDEDEAWRIANARFPEQDRKGELAHQLAMKTSDSLWHKQLSDLGKTPDNNPYWLRPFEHYKTFCPYLVGNYDKVAAELARYIALGFHTFILDIPPNKEELYHTNIAFRKAIEQQAVGRMAQ